MRISFAWLTSTLRGFFSGELYISSYFDTSCGAQHQLTCALRICPYPKFSCVLSSLNYTLFCHLTLILYDTYITLTLAFNQSLLLPPAPDSLLSTLPLTFIHARAFSSSFFWSRVYEWLFFYDVLIQLF